MSLLVLSLLLFTILLIGFYCFEVDNWANVEVVVVTLEFIFDFLLSLTCLMFKKVSFSFKVDWEGCFSIYGYLIFI